MKSHALFADPPKSITKEDLEKHKLEPEAQLVVNEEGMSFVKPDGNEWPKVVLCLDGIMRTYESQKEWAKDARQRSGRKMPR